MLRHNQSVSLPLLALGFALLCTTCGGGGNRRSNISPQRYHGHHLGKGRAALRRRDRAFEPPGHRRPGHRLGGIRRQLHRHPACRRRTGDRARDERQRRRGPARPCRHRQPLLQRGQRHLDRRGTPLPRDWGDHPAARRMARRVHRPRRRSRDRHSRRRHQHGDGHDSHGCRRHRSRDRHGHRHRRGLTRSGPTPSSVPGPLAAARSEPGGAPATFVVTQQASAQAAGSGSLSVLTSPSSATPNPGLGLVVAPSDDRSGIVITNTTRINRFYFVYRTGYVPSTGTTTDPATPIAPWELVSSGLLPSVTGLSGVTSTLVEFFAGKATWAPVNTPTLSLPSIHPVPSPTPTRCSSWEWGPSSSLPPLTSSQTATHSLSGPPSRRCGSTRS